MYGNGWQNQQRDLYKYFAKSFGCRLVDAGIPVPKDVVGILGKERFQTGLRLTMAVNEDILLMPHHDRHGFVGKGDMFGWSPPGIPDSYNQFIWDEHVSWLTICHWYNQAPEGCFGSTWVADSQFIYLGSFAPLDDKSRQEFLQKVNRCNE